MKAKELLNRVCLRVMHGREAWHRRHYRVSVHVVEGEQCVWFEEAGRVVETLALSALIGQFSGRCNLLLSGPSVRDIDHPHLLARYDCIGVNGSPALFNDQIPRMRIYHVNDAAFVRDSLDKFLHYASHAVYTVVDYRGMYEILRLTAKDLPDTKLVVYDSWNYPIRLPVGKIQQLARPPQNRGVYWSNDPKLGLASGGTVAYTAAQIASLGGYRSLYIYGLDLTNSGRFYREDRPQPQMLDKAYADVILPAFELLATQVAGHLAVYNCNPNSRLPEEVLPKLDINTSLSAAATSREENKEA